MLDIYFLSTYSVEGYCVIACSLNAQLLKKGAIWICDLNLIIMLWIDTWQVEIIIEKCTQL